MTSHTGLMRIVVILLIVITFTTIGWISPVLYASHAPDSQFIEVHNFEAQDTTTNANSHLICFDRTVYSSTTGKVFTELYLVDGENHRVEVSSETMTRYFQEGTHKVVTPVELPTNLAEGEYQYLLVVRMELADGRLTRDFAYESNTFEVTDEPANETSVEDFRC